MKEHDYHQKIQQLSADLKVPSDHIKNRILNNSEIHTPQKKPNFMSSMIVAMTFCFVVGFMVSNFLPPSDQGPGSQFFTNTDYIAKFDVAELDLQDIVYIEVDLPEKLHIVHKGKALEDKRSILLMYSVFEDSQIVSFPFRTLNKGTYKLKINLLNQDFETIGTKTMKIQIQEG